MNARLVKQFGPAALILLSGAAASAQCTSDWQPTPFGTFGSYGTDMPVDAMTTWLPAGQTVPRLVIAGRFNQVAGGGFSHIAVWDGTNWNHLSTQGLNGSVIALYDFNGLLVATGSFTSAGGVAVSNVASWNGTSWSAMGSLNSYGAALGVHSGFLFVGGDFTTASGVSANHIARWNGSAWQAANAGVNGTVTALGTAPLVGAGEPSLIIGGNFTTANGMAANHIVGYNLDTGSVWYTLGTGLNNTPNTILGDDGGFYVGGSFTTAGGVSTGGFARWNSFLTHWQANGGFFNGTVDSLANYYDPVTRSSKVAVGGFYPGINNSPSIAFYDGTNYTTPGALGGMGPSGSVFSMASYNSSLYIGGGFLQAGNVFVQNLARWSGNPDGGWSTVQPGASAPVRAIFSGSSGITAGGDFDFTIDAGDQAHRLLVTDGDTTNVFTNILGGGQPNGTDGSVRAIGTWTHGSPIPRTDTIVGGTFTHAASVNISPNIGLFNLSGWSSMGTGTNGQVNSVQQFGTSVYAAGVFTTAGGITTNGIARWSGSWNAVASGLDPVSGAREGDAMAVFNNELIIGGHFGGASGVVSPSIIRWNGTSFAAVPGTTLSGTVRALQVFNNALVVAGDYSTTAGTTLDRVASWNGTTWTPMSTGLPNSSIVQATSLTVYNGELYVGCTSPFNEIGAPAMIYRWTGSSWVAVPGAPDRPVYALGTGAGKLWAGGDFGVTSGRSTPYLAQFGCACYANCDGSTTAPILNVSDFTCFLQQYAAGTSYANCDGSTATPVLNVGDFTCFLQKYAAGCGG